MESLIGMRRNQQCCSSGFPEGPSNAGTTRDSASTSRRTRTPFDCTTSTPTATRTLVDDRSPESIRLFRGRGDGTFSGATSIDVGDDPYRGMSLADVTGDGLADLITPNPDHVAVLVARKDGGFRPRATLPAPFGPFAVVAADLTGDGSAEVLVASYAGGEVAVLVGGARPCFRRIEIEGSPYGVDR